MTRQARTSFFAVSALALAVTGACGSSTRGAEPPKPEAKSPGTVPDSNMDRSQIPDEYKWDLTPIFATEQDVEKAFVDAEAMRKEIDKCDGTLSDPARLAACLDLYFKTHLLTNRLTMYAARLVDTHQTSPEDNALNERALAAMNALMAQTVMFRKAILAMDDAALETAYTEQPALATYKAYIEEIRRRRDHVLGDEGEKLLSLAGDNLWAEIDLNELPSDFEKTFGGLISDLPLPEIKGEDGKPVQLNLANYTEFRRSEDRRVRRDAVEALFATLRHMQHTFAGLIGGQARFSVFLARARGYDTVLDAYLDKDNVDPKLFLNLLKSVEDNLAPLHRYVALRKKVMGLDELHVYDLYTPMVKGVSKKVPFEEALKILPKALAPLGDDYLAEFEKGLDPKNGWCDLYPHKDKDTGAHSASVYGIHPYVMMNYDNSYDALSTLAHEYGHALHSYLSMSNQPQTSWNYKPVVAETASTFNEKLLWDYMYSQAKTDDEKLYMLNRLVEMIRTTIYRQALFEAFELAFHTAAENGTPITAEFLDKTYRDLISKYYGPDFTLGENDGMEWAYVPHFYYKYYMYSYAAGLSSGIALAELVENGGPEARDAYLNMLESGGSKPPVELFSGAGVDWTKPGVVAAAARLMDHALGEMEKILDAKKK